MGSSWGRLYDRLSPGLPGLVETAGIAVGLVLLLWGTLRLRAWFRDSAARDESPAVLLSEMHELHREGGLSEEEFRLIKSRLAQAMMGTVASQRTPTVAKPPGRSPETGTDREEPTDGESPHGGRGSTDGQGPKGSED